MERKRTVNRRTASAVTALKSHDFGVAIRLRPGGPQVLRVPVGLADLVGFFSEVWMEHLRRGQTELALEDLLFRTLPVEGEGRCLAMEVEATAPDGETVSRRFGIEALAPVAVRGANLLLHRGDLQPGQQYFFEFTAHQAAEAASVLKSPASEIGGSFTVRHAPPTCRSHEIRVLLAQADAVGPVEGWSPVFYSHDVFERAERCSRLGAGLERPVESGAVILGQLCSCPESGEFYTVATEVIELEETQQSKYELALTAKSWARIEEAVQRRRKRPGGDLLRIVGQCHGHNFYPCVIEEKDCRECGKREDCTLDSVFISDHDLLWARAVFTRQPWGFCHVFGLDARGGEVHGLFGFRGGGVMKRRGFHLVPELPEVFSEGEKGVRGGVNGEED